MPDTQPTTKTVDVTPIFNYTRPVEIVKRFIEQLTLLSGDEHLGSEAIAYVRTNVDHVRSAVSEVMADDIKQQIADKVFPIRAPSLYLHEFEPYDGDPERRVCQECDAVRGHILHTL